MPSLGGWALAALMLSSSVLPAGSLCAQSNDGERPEPGQNLGEQVQEGGQEPVEEVRNEFAKEISGQPTAVHNNPAAYQESDSSLIQWLQGLETLEATLVQRIYANGELLEESQGNFAMAPPLLVWRIVEPFPQTLLIDESQLQIYDEDLAQLTIRSRSASMDLMPADLLMRPELLANGDYRVSSQIRGDTTTYRLSPSNGSSLFQAVDIVLVRGVLNQIAIYDWQDQQTLLSFTNVAVNRPLSPSRFRLAVPEGTDVIDG